MLYCGFIPKNMYFCFLTHEHLNTMDPNERNALLDEVTACFIRNDISGAFDLLWPDALEDTTLLNMLLRIPRSGNSIFQLTNEQVAKVKAYSDKGNPVAQYVYGRYHQLCNPDDDSMFQAEELFLAAEKAGVGDATACLAILYRDGALGLVDRTKYFHLRDEAYKKCSYKAFQLYVKDIAYGHLGIPKNPQAVLNALLKTVTDKNGKEYDDPLMVDPEMFDLIAQAYEQLGNKEKAIEYYDKAVGMGHYDSFHYYVMATCMDNEGHVVDHEKYKALLDVGCNHNDGMSYTFRAELKQQGFDDLNDEKKAETTEKIKADLQTAYRLGEYIAPWMMGYNYYYGQYGFEENDAQAWMWFAKAALIGSAEGYEMMATMIEESHCPDDDLPEEYAETCWLNALRLSWDDERLAKVCEAYKHGKLTEYATEIEQYYLPEYEPSDDDDDYEDDDGRYDAWA